MSRFLILDGNAILHRAYHALPSLTTSAGVPVNAVFGFTSMLLKTFADLVPDYVACCFDLKAPTFRHKEFKEYKATRPKMDMDLVNQIPIIHQVVQALNIPIFELEGYEGDDLIGTLAEQAKVNKQILQISNEQINKKIRALPMARTLIFSQEAQKLIKYPNKKGEDLEVIIATGDRDTLQLVDETTKVYCPLKGLSNPVLYDQNLVFQKYGLSPSQLIDYKTLMGDPSDNIPGLEGVGPKTAAALLQKFKTVEGIYKNLDKVESASIREKLKAGQKDLKLSKRLVTIIRNVPIKLDLEKCRLADYDREKVIDLFGQLEFVTLISRLPLDIHDFKVKSQMVKGKKPTYAKATVGKDENQMGLF